ncbi:MAG TPA: hypothetical protein VFY56_12015 [Propionibacteriaceae bacterium]|nr:hypothetical protein [Propionibacteriaceae bacterium]
MPTEPAAAGFDSLIDEARTVALSGWHFSFLAGRTTSEILPWSYLDLAVTASRTATRVLDIDTGGGEVLALSTRLPAAWRSSRIRPTSRSRPLRLRRWVYRYEPE